MVYRLTILILLFLPPIVQLAAGQKTSYLVSADKLFLDAAAKEFKDVKSGDTLFFMAGNRDYLLIQNFQGAPGKPIVMINLGGEVIIDTDHYYGISIRNCRYFKFTGTGDSKQTYGFKIKRVATGSGMGIGELSSDFEIDHVSIENCFSGGMYAKTDPDCDLSSVRGTFTQYNTIIHDNYVANVGAEGFYIGNTHYYGQTIKCNEKDVLLMPSLLDGVKVFNNIVKYSGWDGIQVSSASNNCQIYNNTVTYDSQAEVGAQMSGIIIGGGTKADCYNNFISQGKGNGIECHGLGGTRVFNNIIIDAGLSFKPTDPVQRKHGIFVTDTSIQKDSSFYIQHNNIINPKSDGIRFSSVNSKKNLIASNIIINPGSYDLYENGNTSFKGKDSYVMLQYAESDVILQNNYLARNSTSAGFFSQNMKTVNDFKLVAGSPLIDAADIDKKIKSDFLGFPRPIGIKSDIGALEYEPPTAVIIQPKISENKIKLLQNPVKEFLIFSLPDESHAEVFLKIYNLSGIMIAQFQELYFPTDNPTIQSNISKIQSGTYIYTIRSGIYASSGKFIKL